MPYVPAPNLVLVEWRYTQLGQQTENTIHVDNLTAVDAAALEAIAIAAWNWWENDYSAQISSVVNLREVVATDLTTQDGAQFTYAPDTTTVGQNTGGVLPNEAAFCVSLRSASRGRSARGRWYVAGLPTQGQLDANHMASAWIGAVVGHMQGLISLFAGDGRAAVVASYVSNKMPRPGGPVYYPYVSAVAVDDVIDSMRSRRPGIGQ